MFLSKIWFVIVALVAGVALTAAFVAPRPADRRIEQLEGQRLDRAQYAAEQMLKTDARRWIDYAAKLGRDAVITDALDSAGKSAGEPRVVSDTVKGRLKALVPDLTGIGLETLIAVDVKGRVVARVGEKENEAGDSIVGMEIVSDALRGYLSDDAWASGGKLRRVAAAPVLSKTRDRIVGAVIVGIETGKRLAEMWKTNLGVDIAVLLKKDVLASTISEALLSQLPDEIERRKDELAEHKRTRAIAVPMGSDRLIAVAAPFVGQAAEQDAYYVLLGKKAPASDPFALLSSTSADDLKWGNFPWLSLIGGIVAMLGIGLFLQRHEMEKPLSRLRAEVQKLSRGEVQKLADTQYAGKFGGIARDVNAAMERFTHAPTARSETAKKDLNAILDSGAPGEAKTFDLGGSHFSNSLAPPNPFATTPPPPTFGAPPPAFGGPPAPSAPSLFGTPGPMGATPQQRLSSPPISARHTPPPPPPSRPMTTPPVLTPPMRSSDAPTPSPGSLSAQDLDGGDTGRIDEPKTRALDVDTEEAHVREVFAEYVATRQRCGEPTAALTLDKFRAKLDANRQQLIEKYGCRTARFSVYVKEGKAAIKATPVRD